MPAVLDPLAPPAPAPHALVELTRVLPSAMIVSSTVANPKIPATHLADHDLSTAWNSATGRLVGEWIELKIPNAVVRELRMTVGFTATGPKGEDYFAMNQRIARISVLQYGRVVLTKKLDPDRRDLQTIAMPSPLLGWAPIRVRIDEVVPGTMKAWREAAISELEAWGTPDAATPLSTTPLSPVVEVAFTGEVAERGDPFATLCGDSRAEASLHGAALADYLASCERERTEEARMACAAEAPSTPQCEVSPLDDLEAPWGKAAMRCEHFDMTATPWRCWPVFVFGKQLVFGPMLVAEVRDTGRHVTPAIEAVVADLLPAPGAELFVRDRGDKTVAFVCVGGADPRCSEPIDPVVLAKLPDPPTALPASGVVFPHAR